MLPVHLLHLILDQLSWTGLEKYATTSRRNLKLVQAYLKLYPKRVNHLLTLLSLYPEKPWDYDYLSMNRNMTWDIVQAHPDAPWNYAFLSENPNITWDIVQAHPEKPWNYAWLSGNLNITWDIVQAHPDKDWNYCWLSKNPDITWDIVQAHPDKDWNYCWLSGNPNITWDIVHSSFGQRSQGDQSSGRAQGDQEHHDTPWSYFCLNQNKFFQ